MAATVEGALRPHLALGLRDVGGEAARRAASRLLAHAARLRKDAVAAGGELGAMPKS